MFCKVKYIIDQNRYKLILNNNAVNEETSESRTNLYKIN